MRIETKVLLARNSGLRRSQTAGSLASAAVASLVVAVTSATAQASPPWQALPGTVSTSVNPVATFRVDSNGVQKVTVYAMDTSQQLWAAEGDVATRTFTWQNLGCCLVGQPTAIAWAEHREAIALGRDNQIYHNISTDGVNWGGWNQLHTPPTLPSLCSDPKAVSWGPARIDIAVRGCDNHLWDLSFSNFFFSGRWTWTNHGGTIQSAPAPSAGPPGSLDFWFVDLNDNLWNRHLRNNTWSTISAGFLAVNPLLPMVGASNSSTPLGSQTATVVALNLSGEIVSAHWESGIPLTVLTPGHAVAKPVAIASQDNLYFVYWVDSAQGIVRAELGVLGPWGSPNPLGQPNEGFIGSPAAVAASGANLHKPVFVFATKSDGTLNFAVDTP